MHTRVQELERLAEMYSTAMEKVPQLAAAMNQFDVPESVEEAERLMQDSLQKKEAGAAHLSGMQGVHHTYILSWGVGSTYCGGWGGIPWCPPVLATLSLLSCAKLLRTYAQ